MDLQGEYSLVTGAGSGIGAAAALRLAREGANVAIMSRSEDELNEVAGQIRNLSREAIVLVCDVSQPDEMAKAFQQVAKQWGRLDIVVANAGINGTWAPIVDLKVEEWDETLGINLRGTFLTVKHAVPLMKNKGGAIIVISSINGTRVFSSAGASAYACTKAAQVTFTKMAALELAKHRIRVNVVCPGGITTEIDDNTRKRNTEEAAEPAEFPEGKIPLTEGEKGSAEQVADLIAFLSGEASSHITGTEVFIDGGQSLLQG